MTNLSKKEIIEELRYYLSEENINNLPKDIRNIRKIFNEVIESNKIEVDADYLVNNSINDYVLVNSPDGWVEINDY